VEVRNSFTTCLCFIVLCCALYVLSSHNYLVFHSLIELVCIAIGLSIFFLTFHARNNIENNILLLLGLSFAGTSGLHLLHVLTYDVTGALFHSDGNVPTQLWVALRTIFVLTVLGAPFTLGRKLNAGWIITGYGLLGLAFVWAIFSGNFPICFIENQGLTPFKVWMETAWFLGLGAGGALLLQRSDQFDPEVLRLLLWSITLGMVTSMVLAMYSRLDSPLNAIGHILLLLSMLFLHRAVLVTGIATPYRLLSTKLRNAEARYRAIVENTAEGLFQLSLEGVILFANPAAAKIMGYPSVTAALGQSNTAHLIGGKDTFQRQLQQLFSGAPTTWHHIQVLRVDGTPVWVSCSARLVYGDVEPQIYGSIRDITERIRTENLRQDVDRILQHELRSPLNGIVGLSSLMRDEPNLTAPQLEMVDMVVDTGWRMLRMIDESLALRRLEEGQYVPQVETVDLAALLLRVSMWNTHQMQSQATSLQLTLNGHTMNEETPCLLCADAALLEHIFGNVIKNAVEASPRGELIQVHVQAEADSPEVLVEVHNTGTVPPEVRPRFFERYATSGKVKGTGLGTYIARLAVMALGGAIDFRTSEEEGTTVTVRLPLHQGKNTATQEGNAQPAPQALTA